MQQPEDRLQWISCPVCRGDDTAPAFSKNGYSIVVCRKCGLRYVNPRPSPEHLAAFYRQAYFGGDRHDRHDGPGVPHLAQEPMKLATARLRLSLLRQFRAPGRLLDVGCGGAFLAQAAVEQGWKATGLDAAADAIRYTAAKQTVTLVAGHAEQAPFRGRQFDVVVAIDVVEHLFCPRRFLAEARRLLTPGGVLLLETPNMDGWTPRLLGARHPWFRPPEHLTYFTPLTLQRLLEQADFRIEQLHRSARKTLTLEYVLGLTTKTNPLVTRVLQGCLAPFAAVRQRSFTVPLDMVLAVATA